MRKKRVVKAWVLIKNGKLFDLILERFKLSEPDKLEGFTITNCVVSYSIPVKGGRK